MSDRKVTVADIDGLLSPTSPVMYWQDGWPVSRRDIFDDCEVVKLELDTRDVNWSKNSCIAVYVGDRTKR